ncbi:MAG: hypothetical protein JST08_16710 [Actinobacteria bacterium]|nr:hypothetical protein [Actinomycetota bacterium]
MLSIDLDAPRPYIEFLEPRRRYHSERAPFQFSLKDEEVEHFLVIAHTTRHYVRWRLKFSYLLDGQRHSLTVSDKNGAPFQTSASADAARVGYSAEDGWNRIPPPLSRNPLKRPPSLSYYYG